MVMYITRGKQYGTEASYPPAFRAPFGRRRKPIKGGRWMVRKTIQGEWRAWTMGVKALKPRSRRFDTHAEAVSYAHQRANAAQVLIR